MNRALKNAKRLMLLICVTFATTAKSDSTIEQLRQQDPDPNNKPTSPDQLTIEPQIDLQELLRKFEQLDRHFLLMARPNSDEDVTRSLKHLKEQSNTTRDAIYLYRTLTNNSNADNAYFGEARWRALYLLGELRDPDVTALFLEIASSPLPNPDDSTELQFNIEYRLRARAIAGIEKLKDTETLQKLYNKPNVLRGLVTASLYELGATPEGVAKVDGLKVIGYGDPRDYNQRRNPNVLGASPEVKAPTHTNQQEIVEPSVPN